MLFTVIVTRPGFDTGVHKNTIFRIMHKLNDKTPNDYELSNNNEPQTIRSHQNEEIPVPPASFNHFNAGEFFVSFILVYCDMRLK